MNNTVEKSSEAGEVRKALQALISTKQSYCDLRRLLPKLSHLHCLRARTKEGNGATQRKRFNHLKHTALALTRVAPDEFESFTQFLTRLGEPDDVALEGAEALNQASKLVSIAEQRSRELLREIKLTKRHLASLTAVNEPSCFEVEAALWSDLKAVIRAVEQVVKCENHLEKVRSEAYILKYTAQRCDLNVHIAGLKSNLTAWKRTHESGETYLWEKHGDLVQVILAALDAKPTAPLVRAMKDDVMKAQGEAPASLPQRSRRIGGKGQRKIGSSRVKTGRTKRVPEAVGLGLEVVGHRSR